MTDSSTNTYTGEPTNKCPRCGNWYLGLLHDCPLPPYIPTEPWRVPTAWSDAAAQPDAWVLLPVLERIAVALEKIAKEKE